ncbi:hypothetical protein QAD02_001262 [Eretmocerus hayati]|uniref:Uncharacterized protein n=1 Tax=Eretmocerus hayati TaxID=131215 RepID=A0ACC2NGH0_9HYME|nr:hypothetical protein QAD02_001262 [Eretmocerus hayati]
MPDKMITIAYDLRGKFTLDTNAHAQDMPDIYRRLAVVMASHLFYNLESENEWRRMGSYVASHLYKVMDTGSKDKLFSQIISQSQAKGYTIPLSDHQVIRAPRMHSSDPARCDIDKLCGYTNEVNGCLELLTHDKEVVNVSYDLSIICTPGNDESCKPNDEPHFSWDDLVHRIIDAHKNKAISGDTGFSCSVANEAVTTNSRYAAKPVSLVKVT